MKICMVFCSYYPADAYGGPPFSNYYLSKALAKIGQNVWVSTTNANGNKKLEVVNNEFLTLEKDLHVKYYNETIIDKISLPLLFNLWKDIKVADVVNIQNVLSTITIIALIYARWYKKPTIITPRGVLAGWLIKHKRTWLKNIWIKFLVKPLASKSYWHLTAELEKKDIQQFIPDAKIFVVPNGIDLEDYSTFNHINLNQFLEQHTGRRYNFKNFIVSISRLHAKKGYDILIKAFQKIHKKNEGTCLIIAGNDGGEKIKLISLIEKLDLAESVFILDFISGQEKLDFLANADIFALPSHHENFGNVYAEALAMGTPVLASTNTPWKEVEEYKCGRWVDNSVNSVTKALSDMLKSDYKKMGQNGRQFIRKYDWVNIARDMVKVYKQIYTSH